MLLLRRRLSSLPQFRFEEAGVRAKLKELLSPLKNNTFTGTPNYFRGVLKLCGNLGTSALPEGKFIHSHIVARGLDNDPWVGNSLVYMYGHCGSFLDAQYAFDRLSRRGPVSWNALVAAYAQNGHCKHAIELFRRIQHDGEFVLASTLHTVFNSCMRLENASIARNIYASIQGTYLIYDNNCTHALLNTFRKCGTVRDVENVFNVLQTRGVVAWTILISAYAQAGHMADAMASLSMMQLDGVRPNEVTFTAALEAWEHDLSRHKQQKQLESLRKVHEQLRENGLNKCIMVGTSLVEMYIKSGSLEEARLAFDSMTASDVVSWTAMISGYVKFSQASEALKLFKMMQLEGVKPNFVTCTISLNACCSGASKLPEGRSIHERIIEAGFDKQNNVNVGNALVAMYGGCGAVGVAKKVFDDMQVRDNSSWNSLMNAFSQHGYSTDTLDMFWLMLQDGNPPDHITFVEVLCACSCGGMLEEGYSHYMDMIAEHGITPTSEHLGCMVDLLTKVGRLREAEELLLEMPESASDERKWSALLSACRVHGDVQRGRSAMVKILDMGLSSSAYMLMSSILAERLPPEAEI